MSEPPRPASLPPTARWRADWGEFLVCDQVDGLDHGEGRTYRPDGSFGCVSQFVRGVEHGPYERFHQDGTWSQRGTMRHDERHGEIRWRRTDAPTTETTVPDACPPEIREVSATFVDGVPGPVRYWDADGVERTHTGEALPPRPATVPPDAGFEPEERVWFTGLGSQSAEQRRGWWRWWTEAGVLFREQRSWRGKLVEQRSYEGDKVTRVVHSGGIAMQRRLNGVDVDLAGAPLPARPPGVPAEAEYHLGESRWVAGPGVAWVPSEQVPERPLDGRYLRWTPTGALDKEWQTLDGRTVFTRTHRDDGTTDAVYDAAENTLFETYWRPDGALGWRRDVTYGPDGVVARRFRTAAGGDFEGVRDGDGANWTFREGGRVVAQGRLQRQKAVGRWTFLDGDERYVVEMDGTLKVAPTVEFRPSWIFGYALRAREGGGPRLPELAGVDAIDWATLEGAFSEEVVQFPTLLQALTSPIPAVRGSALGGILSEIEHQGSVYPSTAAVMPFLLAVLALPNVEVGELLGWIVHVVESAVALREQYEDEDDDGDGDGDVEQVSDEDPDEHDGNEYLRAAAATRRAVQDRFPLVAAHLAAHPKPVLALAGHAGAPGLALLRAAAAHPDPTVAAVALHGLVGRSDTGAEQVAAWLDHADPLVRVCVALRAAKRFRGGSPDGVVDVLLAALDDAGGLDARYRRLPFVDHSLLSGIALGLAQIRTPRAMGAAPALAGQLDRLDLFTLDAVTYGLLRLCFGDGTGPYAPASLEVLASLAACERLRGFANFARSTVQWRLPSEPEALRALVAELRAAPDPEGALRARILTQS